MKVKSPAVRANGTNGSAFIRRRTDEMRLAAPRGARASHRAVLSKYEELFFYRARVGAVAVASFALSNERTRERRVRHARVVFIRVRIRLARRYETLPHTRIDVICTPLVNTAREPLRLERPARTIEPPSRVASLEKTEKKTVRVRERVRAIRRPARRACARVAPARCVDYPHPLAPPATSTDRATTTTTTRRDSSRTCANTCITPRR